LVRKKRGGVEEEKRRMRRGEKRRERREGKGEKGKERVRRRPYFVYMSRVFPVLLPLSTLCISIHCRLHPVQSSSQLTQIPSYATKTQRAREPVCHSIQLAKTFIRDRKKNRTYLAYQFLEHFSKRSIEKETFTDLFLDVYSRKGGGRMDVKG
jgi:hypothetical protein